MVILDPLYKESIGFKTFWHRTAFTALKTSFENKKKKKKKTFHKY